MCEIPNLISGPQAGVNIISNYQSKEINTIVEKEKYILVFVIGVENVCLIERNESVSSLVWAMFVHTFSTWETEAGRFL